MAVPLVGEFCACEKGVLESAFERMGFRVRDATKAYALALERGAELAEIGTGVMELHIPAIRGIGHSLIYLIDRSGEGIQHIALARDDLYASLDSLKQKDLRFAPPPTDIYYEMLESRLPRPRRTPA